MYEDQLVLYLRPGVHPAEDHGFPSADGRPEGRRAECATLAARLGLDRLLGSAMGDRMTRPDPVHAGKWMNMGHGLNKKQLLPS